MRPDLPTGTVTFLFTDVEGSTQLLEEIGDEAYDEALAEHRRIVRKACTKYAGVEVDTQGDAFFFGFSTAPAALAAASAMTTALARGPIRVRIGLHTGKPRVSDEGYVGKEVHFAARVAATGHGGQIVLSKTTSKLVEADLIDLGEHRLKDISEPVSIYQLGNESFPPLKTISNTNLPRPASSFVGRDSELSEVLTKIEQGVRLLTLTGPGGSGKTRLALEAATTLIPEYRAGVFWVGLASLRDPSLVTAHIAQKLGAKDGLAEHIGEREMLLLLDNLEQVIEAAPDLASLLEACPNLALLVTSRELLRVRGEVEYPVPPLASPEAVMLFGERSGLEPSEVIAELCARLDNLPLAVELAAARTRALTAAEIVERLSQRLDLLKGGRDADPRQATLRATIEWSYELLSRHEQQLFTRLSVFAGGCTLEAAEKVTEGALDTLQSLVEKSLLRFSAGRYWMLETIREYAAEQLEAAMESEAIRHRHAEYYASAGEAASEEIDRGRQSVWLDWVAIEHDNARGAIDWAIASENRPLALRLSGMLWRFWVVHGHVREGRAWLERSVAVPGTGNGVALARALDGLAYLMAISGDGPAAVAVSDRSIALWRQTGDRHGLAQSLLRRQIVLAEAGDEAGYRRMCEETIVLAREIGAEDVLATSLNNLADTLLFAGEYAGAERLCEESVEIHRKRGDVYDGAGALLNAAHAALAQGKLDVAGDRYGDALQALSRSGAPDVLAWGLVSGAALAEARADFLQAARLLGAAKALFEQVEAVRTFPYEEALRSRTLSRLHDALGPAELEAAFQHGAALSSEQAAAEAIAAAASTSPSRPSPP